MSAQRIERKGEYHRKREPDSGPDESLSKFYDMSMAMEKTEIGRQENQDAGDKTNPMPAGDFNQGHHGENSKHQTSSSREPPNTKLQGLRMNDESSPNEESRHGENGSLLAIQRAHDRILLCRLKAAFRWQAERCL